MGMVKTCSMLFDIAKRPLHALCAIAGCNTASASLSQLTSSQQDSYCIVLQLVAASNATAEMQQQSVMIAFCLCQYVCAKCGLV